MPKPGQSTTCSDHERHLSEMRKYYAATAGDYNAWHAYLSAKGVHNFAVRQLLSLVKSRGYRTVLDICCGTGRAVKACSERGVNVHGVDASQELINEGIRAWGLPASSFTCADATKLPFADQEFDVCCILGALHHSAIPEQIVQESIRVSRYALVISDEGNHLYGGVRQVLKKLGLFNLVYRLMFHRAPRTGRRVVISAQDGPAYAFSVEEVMPLVVASFRDVRTFQFYLAGGVEVVSAHLPRLCARNVVVTADTRQ